MDETLCWVTDAEGKVYLVDRAILDEAQVTADEARDWVERARTVPLDRVDVPPELREDWERALDSGVAGRDGFVAAVISVQVLVVAFRILRAAELSERKRRALEAAHDGAQIRTREAVPRGGPFRSHDASGCAGCGKPLDVRSALFSEEGLLTCRDCWNKQQVALGTVRGLE